MSNENAPVEQTGPESVTPPVKEQNSTVSYDTHRRLLEEKKKLQAERDELLAKHREREDTEAKKRGDYETLLKNREEELTKERSIRQELEERFTNGRKINAVVDALGGSVDPKWIRLIDVSSVALHPETGEIDAMSVAKYVEALRKEWPEMVPSKRGLPPQAPIGREGGQATISYEEWKRLSASEMRKWNKSQIVD